VAKPCAETKLLYQAEHKLKLAEWRGTGETSWLPNRVSLCQHISNNLLLFVR
jgi:hypothetical protein